MAQSITSTAVLTHRSPNHGYGHGTDVQPIAGDSSVRPLLLTMVTTLTLAMVLIVLAATSFDISVLDAGTFFPA